MSSVSILTRTARRGGRLMLHGGGKWDESGGAFCDAPRLSGRIRSAAPCRATGPARGSFPPAASQRRAGGRLRKELEAALALPHAQACDTCLKLEAKNRERRGWVWAQLGESPSRTPLSRFGRLALARSATRRRTPQAMAADYAAHGWRCDRAAMDCA